MSRFCRSRPHDAWLEWSDKRTAIGAATLHTTTESRTGPNPCVSQDGSLAVAFDGYLANYHELRRDLLSSGADLRNRSDCELVLASFERWGKSCLPRLEGEFALIAADQRTGEFICARDPFGFRPLYYTRAGDAFLAASDVGSLIHALPEKPEPNLEFLAQLVAARLTASEQTAWNGIFRVPPASLISWSDNRISTDQYFSPNLAVGDLRRPDSDYVDEYLDVFRDSVRQSSRTDRTIAVEVSGGLDSSSVLCLAERLQTEGKLEAPAIAAFAMRGAAGSPADEISYAREVTEALQLPLEEAELHHPPLDWFASQTRAERDIATYPNGIQSLDMNARVVGAGARAVLSGYGGDQWLDGTRGYIEQSVRSMELGLWSRQLRRDITVYGVGNTLRTFARRSMLAALPASLRGPLRRLRGFRFELEIDFLKPQVAEAIIEAEARFEAELPDDPVARSKMASFLSPWARLGNDMMARQHCALGLESRNPMSSRRIVEFCCALPEDLKLRGGERRWVHREAMKGILPENVRTRQTKAHFPASYGEQDAAGILDDDLAGALEKIIDMDRFGRFLQTHRGPTTEVPLPFVLWGTLVANWFLVENCQPKS